MKSAPAIAFDYAPSRALSAAIVGMTLLALAALALSGVPLWPKVAIAVAACAYAGHALRRFWLLSVRRVAWHAAGHWRIADSDGAEHVADLEHAVVRGAWIVLRLRRSDGRRLALILAPGNSDAELRRRLRVRLARTGTTLPAALS